MMTGTHKFNYYIASFISVFLLALAVNAVHEAGSVRERYKSRVRLAAFVKPNPDVSLDVLKERLLNLDGVREMQYVAPDKALEKALRETPAIKDVLVTGDNPFPAYFVITPASMRPSYVEALGDRVSSMDGIDEVRYDANLVNMAEKLRRATRFAARASSALLAIALLLILARLALLLKTRKFSLNRYIFTVAAGLLSGLAAAAAYYVIAGKLLHPPFALMPLSYALYLIPAGALFTLIWEN